MSIICPECGTEIADGEKFCPTCAWRVRKLVKKVEVTTAEPPEEQSAAVQPEETLTCANCGAELPKGSLFCNKCGTKVEQPITNCPECGADLPKGSLFCNKCGTKISAAASTETQAAAKAEPPKAASAAPNPDMVLIQGGTFKMGSDNVEVCEKPAHGVTLSSYYISKYQVTQNDWEKVMGKNPSKFKDTPENGEKQGLRPVECVSWYDAIEYCNERSEMEGLTPCYVIDGENVTCDWSADGYRLPTEAEWEYAARGGGKASRQTEYSGSDNIDEVAWYYGNKTHQVGLKKPNAAGLYDMNGNVWEWCWDRYGDYPSGAASNPRGASSGEDRVFRGGTWKGLADFCRVSFRSCISPDFRDACFGLRVCSRA